MINITFPKKFGNSGLLCESIPKAEFAGRPLADHPAVKNGRKPGALLLPREPLDAPTVAEAISVISCWYEDKTEWGDRVGWIYGSVTEDVVTGYRMHNRGWKSVYCVPKQSDSPSTDGRLVIGNKCRKVSITAIREPDCQVQRPPTIPQPSSSTRT